MKPNRVSLAVIVALALAMPAAAQNRAQPRQEGQRGQEQRQAQPRQEGQREGQRQAQPAQPRQQARQQEQPQAAQQDQREQEQRRAEPRQQRGSAPEAPAQRRQVAPRRGQDARGIYNAPENERHGDRELERRAARVAPYRPYYYARPYYNFRPRFEVGFGLWLGYPVPYPYYAAYAYPDAYAEEYPPPPPPDAIEVDPGEAYGGLSFDITPPTSEVYIDGEDAGEVDDYTPSAQPLTVGVGGHHVEIDAPGYRPMAFDVDVGPGQVIPFRGDLQPD